MLAGAPSTSQGWNNAKRLAEDYESLFPGAMNWTTQISPPQSMYCDAGRTKASVWYVLDGHTKRTPRDLLEHVAQSGPQMGFYPNSQPVTNGNGLQLTDLRPDGYQSTVGVYNYGLIDIFVRTPCLRWDGSPGG